MTIAENIFQNNLLGSLTNRYSSGTTGFNELLTDSGIVYDVANYSLKGIQEASMSLKIQYHMTLV